MAKQRVNLAICHLFLPLAYNERVPNAAIRRKRQLSGERNCPLAIWQCLVLCNVNGKRQRNHSVDGLGPQPPDPLF